MRVLCLHGGQQTAELFENQINKLCVALRDIATFTFLDAPFLLPLKDERDDVQTRSWCDSSGDYAESDALIDAHMQSPDSADILLGFSQGGLVICRYLLRHAAGRTGASASAVRCPLPKGVIFAGTPDPRRSFAGSAIVADCPPVGDSSSLPLLGLLPSLHLVGRKDTVVLPEESAAFAADCGPSGELYMHDHAHSFPQQQAVLAAVRSFCESVAMDPAELASLAEARDMELEMVAAMHASQYGDDCVLRPRDMPGGAVVTLPLLSADALETGAASAAAMERALSHLSLRLRLPRRYPAVAPGVDIINGPTSHSVAFAHWRARLIAMCEQYMAEDLGLGSAMVLPVYMYASDVAMSELETLREIFAPSKDGGAAGAAESGGSTCNDPSPTAAANSAWALESEEARARYVESAEEEATRLLKRRLGAESHVSDGSLGGGAGAEEAAGGLGGAAVPSRSSGGSWTLTIGLIGKPSAGKSTFFNAVTDPQSESEVARVAAFPFTTIEPNVGMGFGGILCPCIALRGDRGAGVQGLRAGFTECDAAFGHVTAHGCPCYRRHAILVKDVAGLVQGAYQGKGKGNQFLNDLCDADVLVHIVDGAGATDADGASCAPGQGSTLSDIAWVRAEVHSWVYDNLRAKWDSIRRVPGKLRTMFSGYRSTPAFVDSVLLRMGVANEAALRAQLPLWGPTELHLLVALYTRMRFPMVVALNKADLPTAPALAQQLRLRYPEETFIPVSAQTEWDLLALRKKGLVHYLSGERTFQDVSGGERPSRPVQVTKEDAARLARLRDFFRTALHPGSDSASLSQGNGDVSAEALRRRRASSRDSLVLSSTGVQDVLAEALARCAAILVYPVSTFQPAIPSLKHCFSFKPGTTAEDVFWAMTYARLLDGNLVRFEVADAFGSTSGSGGSSAAAGAGVGSGRAAAATSVGLSTLKRMDPLPTKAVLVRVLSNKRQMT